MLSFKPGEIVAVGEAMIEMALNHEGLYRRGFAGDTFNTIWHMAQVLGNKFKLSFVTKVGEWMEHAIKIRRPGNANAAERTSAKNAR